MGVDQMTRIRHVTAVLGPTNTGKTHLAIERMLGHETGMIGLPLRLLAREIYDRVSARVGADQVALITGEEKIKPEGARYWICTVEAMPQDVTVDFLAIDEIQLAADLERGHVFTDRLLHARGEMESLVLGASTMRDAITDLIPGANFISRPRLSKLTYAGQKKITRLPPRSAIVAFSAAEVYAIAELIRRQRGGAAVVLGALSPRTRNAQVALYQSGDVDFMVATDAIGMGLNLDVDHVSFSSLRKFDGQKFRNLTPAELAQIAGRAGRHMNDGTFGVTGDAEPLDQSIVDRLEDHEFDAIKVLQWRARDLDFSSIDALRDSLRVLPGQPGQHRLSRTRGSDDTEALESVSRDSEVAALARTPKDVEALWEVCQIPDYRKISTQNHADLIASVYKDLQGPSGCIDEDWFAKQVAFSDRTDGDIDTLSNRLAHIRTWTFVANRADWLRDPAHWQGRTREIEDNLSDALHACLTERFVDVRASALMRGMKDNQELNAEIGEDGSILVESHYVGSLKGFRYIPDADAAGLQGKTTRNAAGQVLSREMSMRARRVVAAKNDAFTLARDGRILWRGDDIAKLDAGDDPLKPQVSLIADDSLQGADRDRVLLRVQTWVTDTIAERLKPLVDISKAEDIDGLARGIAFQLIEGVGALKRESVAADMKALDQTARAQLRRYGVRFGAFNIFFPTLLKPAAADLLLTLWCLRYGKDHGIDPAAPPEPPRAGLTSAKVEDGIPEAFYRAYGFHVCGPRAVRLDMLERLADLIRPLLGWRPGSAGDTPPKGATGDGAFVVIPEMMSILGCSPEELGHVLNVLGFRSETRPVPAVVPPKEPAAAPPDAVETAAEVAPDNSDGDAASIEPSSAAVSDAPPAASIETAVNADATAAPAGASAIEADTGGEAATPAVMPEVTSPPSAPEAAAAPEQAPTAQPASAGEPAAPAEASHTAEVSEAAEVSQTAQTIATTESAAEVDTPTPVADAQSGDGEPVDAEPGIAEPDVPEPATIEVWRPRRKYDGNQQRRGKRRRRDGEAAPGERERTADAGDRAPRADKPAGEQGDRRNGNRNARPNRQDRDARGGDGKPRFDKRGRRDGAKRQGPTVQTSSPPRQKGADPDSPFAALRALKETLEKSKSDG